jgi:hypothetical protein
MRSRETRIGLKYINIFEATDVEILDQTRYLLRLCIPDGDVYFQAPNRKVFINVQSMLCRVQEEFSLLSNEKRLELRRASLVLQLKAAAENAESSSSSFSQYASSSSMDRGTPSTIGSGGTLAHQKSTTTHHVEPSLMDWPKTKFALCAHIAVLPIKAAL